MAATTMTLALLPEKGLKASSFHGPCVGAPFFSSAKQARLFNFEARPLSLPAITQRKLSVSATLVQPELVETEKVNYEELAKELRHASPLQIMEQALSMFGHDIAIAFSGAEDVALIEYAHLTGRPFRVFSLDTGRLNPETYRFFAEVEKHYNIHIEYMFPDAAEVENLVRTKGLFSFYQDGHQECCAIRKVRPLKRALKGLRAWITGQRRDQSPGTRDNVPVVQVDPSFEGLEGGFGSLIKWNPLSQMKGTEVWKFLRTMNVPINVLHSQGYISIGCEPCTRPVLPGQHERQGRWWWEDATAKECGLHKGNIEAAEASDSSSPTFLSSDSSDLFKSNRVLNLTRKEIEILARSDRQNKSWIIVLYAPWCPYCQGMEASYDALADRLHGTDVMVCKFQADGDQKPFAQQELQLKSFPTIIFLPSFSNRIIKYPSEQRDTDSLYSFVQALQ